MENIFSRIFNFVKTDIHLYFGLFFSFILAINLMITGEPTVSIILGCLVIIACLCSFVIVLSIQQKELREGIERVEESKNNWIKILMLTPAVNPIVYVLTSYYNHRVVDYNINSGDYLLENGDIISKDDSIKMYNDFLMKDTNTKETIN